VAAQVTDGGYGLFAGRISAHRHHQVRDPAGAYPDLAGPEPGVGGEPVAQLRQRRDHPAGVVRDHDVDRIGGLSGEVAL
jgi:hypothetical protein